jgi:hypothetical protein
MPLRIVKSKGSEIMLDLASQAVRNTLQNLGQVEARDDRVIDFQQDPSTFGGYTNAGRRAPNVG